MPFYTHTSYKIRGKTGKDLSAASNCRIDYTRPDGVTGFFSVQVEDGTRMVYVTSAADITIVGNWKFQGYAEIDGLPKRSPIVKRYFEPPIS